LNINDGLVVVKQVCFVTIQKPLIIRKKELIFHPKTSKKRHLHYFRNQEGSNKNLLLDWQEFDV